MAHDTVRGVVIIARAGDRVGYEQNPMNYDSSPTECTPLGEVRFYFASITLCDFYIFYPHVHSCYPFSSVGSVFRPWKDSQRHLLRPFLA